MSKNHSLGPGAVLDGHMVQVGTYVQMGDQVVKVDKIIGDAVYLKPVVGIELWRYKIAVAWRDNKVLLMITLLIIGIVWIAAQFDLLGKLLSK